MTKLFSQYDFKHGMYCVLNRYMNGIHCGIQASHAVTEMFVDDPDNAALQRWASKDKTMILLHGGMQSHLLETRAKIQDTAKEYRIDVPTSEFREEQDALNNALTCVAFVLPFYDDALPARYKRFLRACDEFMPKSWAK